MRPLGLIVAAIALISCHAGCKTTTTSRSGVTKIEPVGGKPAAALSAPVATKPTAATPSNVVPALYTKPKPTANDPTSAECIH